MSPGATAFIAGAFLGCFLVALGVGSGFLLGRKRGRQQMAGVDTERVQRMVQELSTWTTEYSGNVSQYQNQLGKIHEAMQGTTETISPEGARLASTLERIMQSNRALQERLEAAEKQLERQTKQIDEYLSEARTDALTGLANRRAFDKKLDEMFAQFRRGGRSFCMALVDIDHFKQINDQHGHPVGDLVLRQVARMLSDHIEGAFIVARFGGEEFAVLMPTPLAVAGERLNRVRKLISRQPFQSDKSSVSATVSIGVTEPRDELLIGPIVRRADEALYAAKGRGRNRVYFHDGRQSVLVGAPEVAGSSNNQS